MEYHELLMKVIIGFTSDLREEIYEHVEAESGKVLQMFDDWGEKESKIALDYIVCAHNEGFEIQGELVERDVYNIIMTGRTDG